MRCIQDREAGGALRVVEAEQPVPPPLRRGARAPQDADGHTSAEGFFARGCGSSLLDFLILGSFVRGSFRLCQYRILQLSKHLEPLADIYMKLNLSFQFLFVISNFSFMIKFSTIMQNFQGRRLYLSEYFQNDIIQHLF